MDIKDLSPEVRAIMLSSLEATIADYERKILDVKIAIAHLADGLKQPIQAIRSNLDKPIVNKATRKKRDGGWFDKIQAVLEKATAPLTSREILNAIAIEFPEVENNATSMGSLSPALNSSADKGELIKNYKKGSFATFELPNKNVINFNNAVNQ
ncbi:hypothetical protein [Mucilaginibacter xinganensis]|uniref:Uncharacterized protein n=1 Tax=Mucilaginibacter xinganensis TaxID=1234841 RepID=A0A223NZS2_9SPHI|nr:hypothetical protein [Mucilaginibacter xinganensis]ASU35377.1 hypothetical protein MuYL_3492 [Mucilaginibacter xinganensis]